MRLVLQNFFECMYNQHADDDDATSAQKSQALPAAVDAADARAMEKFAHVAEKFVQKSIKAALAPYKDAIMRFSQVQMDTVRRMQVLCLLDYCLLGAAKLALLSFLIVFIFVCFFLAFIRVFRFVSERLLIPPATARLFPSCSRRRSSGPTRTKGIDKSTH